MYTLVGTTWKRACVYISQRNKGGNIPKNAIRGRNGTYICLIPAEYYFTFKNDNGACQILELYSNLKTKYPGKKFTNKFRKSIEEEIKSKPIEDLSVFLV